MNKKKILSVVLAVILVAAMLPAMVFGEEQTAEAIGGQLKIKGLPAVGTVLGADYAKVKPEGITDDSVTFQWLRNAEGAIYEVGNQSTYQITEEDLGCTLILVITGKTEAGLCGSLTADTGQVAATQEEAAALNTEDVSSDDETELVRMLEAAFGEIWDFSGTETGELPVDESSYEFVEEYPEDISEDNAYEEESYGENVSEENVYEGNGYGEIPYGEAENLSVDGEEILEIPEENIDELIIPSEEGEEIIEENSLDSVAVPAENQSDEAAAHAMDDAADAQTVFYGAEAATADGTGILDFGTIKMESDEAAQAQYVTVTNTGNQPLTFFSISPEHFMVQDITDPLDAGASVELWIQPRDGLQPGEYQDTITYSSEEGAEASFLAVVNVINMEEAEEELISTTEPGTEEILEAEAAQYSIKADNKELAFQDLQAGYTQITETMTVTVTNDGTDPVTVALPVGENFDISLLGEEGTSSKQLSAGENAVFNIQPKLGLVSGEYEERIVFTIDEDLQQTAEVMAKVSVTEQQTPVVEISADQTEFDFGTVSEGYTEAPQAQTVTLTNVGTEKVVFSQVDSQYFITGELGEVDVNGFCTMSIQPKTGLPVGDYTETLNVNDEDGITLLNIIVYFEVEKAAPVYGMSVTPDSLVFGNKESGYGQSPEAQTVTVTNTGNTAIHLKQPTASAYDIGALSQVVIEEGQSSSFTVQPKAGLGEGTYIEDISIPNQEGIEATVNAQFTVTRAVVKLTSVHSAADITGLKNGTAKTVKALGLPATVNIETTNGTMKANVTWDVNGCSYDPKSAERQTFTVKGAVKLPEGIENPDGIALESTVNVTVEAYTPRLASASAVAITGIGADVRYTTETKISFTAVGSGMDNDNPGKGDTRYVPRVWHVLEDRVWDSAPYTAVFRMGLSGDYTLTVRFYQQKFDGSNWVDTGEQTEKSVNFTVAKAQVSAQNITPVPQESNRRTAVQTGDYTNILLFVVLLGAAVICIAAVTAFLKKKKK